MKKYQLIVAGGGLTGVAAAVTAARKGIKTLLIEQGNALGGAAVNCLVNPFMDYWTKNDKGEPDYLSCGFFAELVDELKRADAIDEHGTRFDEEYLKLLLNRVTLAAGVEILFNTTVIDSDVTDGHINGITVFNKSGKTVLYAHRFIDATGDADLAAMSGVPFEQGRKEDGLCQPMTLCFRVGNIDLHRLSDEWRKQMNNAYTRYKAEGRIGNPRENVLVFKTLCPSVLHFNTTRVVKLDPTNGDHITAAEIAAREQVYEIMDMLKKEIAGFEDAVLLSTASKIGVRESRRIVGKHMLTENEIKDCTVFDDSIAVGNYDIDIHNPAGTGTSHYYFPAGRYYTIPYRSMVPMGGADNLLVAGRCISATHEAQASIRIMPICCCLGEAAGAAAKVAMDENAPFDSISVKAVQQILTQNGARIY